MDYTALLVKMLPASVLPYLKFVVTVLGGAASSVLAVYPGVDHRIVIATAILTALGTYLTPNVQPVKLVGSVSTQAASVEPEPAPVTAQTQAPTAEVPAAPAPVKEVGV